MFGQQNWVESMQEPSNRPADAGLVRHALLNWRHSLTLGAFDSAQIGGALAFPPKPLRVLGLSAFAIILGLVWARLVLTWTTGPVLPVSEFVAPQVNASASPRLSELNTTALVSSDPFFASVPDTLRSVSPAVNAPETTLDLKLFGIRAGQDSSQGSAIVRTPDKRQGSFQVGDALFDGVRLEQVLPDRVVISRGGVRESLYLDPEGSRSRASLSPATNRAAAGPSDSQLSISDALERIQLRPRIVGNTISGFYVAPESDPATLALGGLEINDVVMSVNGVSLVSAERITDVIEELQDATFVEMQIERDGASNAVEIDLSGAR